MEKVTTGTVISVKKQWWIKINTKPIRKHALDGAVFPYVIRVKYLVDEKEYVCKKWINPGIEIPQEGSLVKVSYDESNPSKGKVLLQ